MGRLGEIIAARFFNDHGATVGARNVVVGRGEIDLVVSFAGRPVAVEVKTSRIDSVGEPVYRFDTAKRRQVRRLGREHGAARVDYVGVRVGPAGAVVRWLPNVG